MLLPWWVLFCFFVCLTNSAGGKAASGQRPLSFLPIERRTTCGRAPREPEASYWPRLLPLQASPDRSLVGMLSNPASDVEARLTIGRKDGGCLPFTGWKLRNRALDYDQSISCNSRQRVTRADCGFPAELCLHCIIYSSQRTGNGTLLSNVQDTIDGSVSKQHSVSLKKNKKK